jgi:hypothetical protein
LGIFPILPGCLCQVLEAFGVSAHDSSSSQLVCVMTDGSGKVSCHCDHTNRKDVEIPAGNGSDSLERFYALSLQWGEPFEFPDNARVSSRQDRAPPGSFASHSARRVFSGVYLI